MKHMACYLGLMAGVLASTVAQGQKNHAEKIYRKVSDSVIRIYSTDPGTENLRAQGSGVILKDKGWIVTNHHLMIQGAMLYALRGDTYIPLDSIVASDPQRDILVLQIASTEEAQALTAKSGLKTGNSDDLKPGQRIYAIGNPLNFENTISEGIVSGLRSSMVTGQALIQISAPISQGSSGGAVVDAKGRLVGISTMVMSGEATQNLNFAVAVNDVLGVATGGLKAAADSVNAKINQLYEEGNAALRLKRYDEAIAHYQKALAMMRFGDPGVLYFQLGKAHAGRGDWDEGLMYFSQIQNGPMHVNAMLNAGHILNKQTRYMEAIRLYERVLAADPESMPAHQGMAEAYYRLKMYDSAVGYLKRMLEKKYFTAESLLLMGHVGVETGMMENAIFFYEEALKLDPTSEETHYYLYFCYTKQGDTAKAEYHLECAGDVRPEK